MARIETWLEQDLNTPVKPYYLKGNVFNLDNVGNLIGVKVYNNGSSVTLSGSVTGYCVLADGTTVSVTGTRSGNSASITLPQSALSVPGMIGIAIKLIDGSTITTLAVVVATVYVSRTDTVITPSQQVITDWSNSINAALQNVENALSQMVKYVSARGSDGNNGDTAATPYATIGAAIASGARTIYVATGTYEETVSENTAYRYGSVKIIGNKVTMTGSSTLLHFRYCNVEISGFNFVIADSSSDTASCLHLLNCTGKVTDCTASGAPYMGFRLDGCLMTVERCTAHDCGTDGFNGHTVDTGYDCDITLIDCVAYDNADDGASVHEHGKLHVFGGEYYGNTSAGIAPAQWCDFEIHGAYVHGNGTGIEAINSSWTSGAKASGTVEGCVIDGNNKTGRTQSSYIGYGIIAGNYTVNILGNAITNNNSGTTKENSGGTINVLVDAKLGEDVTSLKNAIDGITTGESLSFALNTTWSQGGVNQEGEFSSWARIRTDYIDVDGIGIITLIPSSGYAFYYTVYNSSKQVTRYGTWATDSVDVLINDNEQYIRVMMTKNPEGNLSPSAGSNLSATAVYKIAQDIENANNAIKDMESFLISDLVWEKGGISAGANYNTNSKIRTGYKDVSQYAHLTAVAQTGYKYNIVFYNASKTYLFTAPSAGYTTGEKIFKIDKSIAYIRVCFSKDPDEDVSDTSMSSNFSLSADWKLPGEVKDEFEKTDLMSSMTWIRGTLDNDGNYFSSTSRVVTDSYLSVTGLKSIIVDPLNNLVQYSVKFYGDNGKIAETPVTFTDTQTITIPANVTKIKMVLINNPDAWIADGTMGKSIRVYAGSVLTNDLDGNQTIRDYFVATSVNKKEIPALESGKTIIAIGDSITAATGETGWTAHFAQMTGVTFVNKAVGGATFGESVSDSGHRISTQIANVTDAQWESADLVIVAAGTNDYQHETPLDELKEKVQADITAIKTKTNKPIVFITPIRRGLAVNNVIILKIAMISGIIANVALANQCNVICGYDFPIPTYNINGLIDDMTQSDALHPNAYGANVYARSVINALM